MMPRAATRIACDIESTPRVSRHRSPLGATRSAAGSGSCSTPARHSRSASSMWLEKTASTRRVLISMSAIHRLRGADSGSSAASGAGAGGAEGGGAGAGAFVVSSPEGAVGGGGASGGASGGAAAGAAVARATFVDGVLLTAVLGESTRKAAGAGTSSSFVSASVGGDRARAGCAGGISGAVTGGMATSCTLVASSSVAAETAVGGSEDGGATTLTPIAWTTHSLVVVVSASTVARMVLPSRSGDRSTQ
jgi:hypothetical protein